LLYHLIVAVIGIALLFCGWVWVQTRAVREECEGLTNEAACAVGPRCHGCPRAAVAKDPQEWRRLRVSLFPGERAWPGQASRE
jgi:hypothetical protein